jgi:hypothetical protein
MSGGSSVPSGDAKQMRLRRQTLTSSSPRDESVRLADKGLLDSTFLKPALFQPPDCFPQHAVAKVSLSHLEQF